MNYRGGGLVNGRGGGGGKVRYKYVFIYIYIYIYMVKSQEMDSLGGLVRNSGGHIIKLSFKYS